MQAITDQNSKHASGSTERAWMIDAAMSHHAQEGLYAFCPIEFDDNGNVTSILTGVTMISNAPPNSERCVGIFHQDGQSACDAWEKDHSEQLRALFSRPAQREMHPMTSDAKHTPAPWSVHDDGWQPWEGAIEIRGRDGTICWTPSGGEERENAHLISAAPDMLAALKAVFDSLDAWDGTSAVPLEYQHHEAMRAAIARAEGRAT